MRVEINYKDGVIESPEEVKQNYIKEVARRWKEGFKKNIEDDLQKYLDEDKELNEKEIDEIFRNEPKPKANPNSHLLPNHYAIL